MTQPTSSPASATAQSPAETAKSTSAIRDMAALRAAQQRYTCPTLRITLAIEAGAFITFALLACALLRVGDLSMASVANPDVVLAQAATHQAIDPLIHAMSLVYLVLGICVIAWALLTADVFRVPAATLTSNLFGVLGGLLFICAAIIDLRRAPGSSAVLLGVALTERDMLALSLMVSNVAVALYGLAVVGFSYGALRARLATTLPPRMVALGFIWGLLALASGIVPVLGVPPSTPLGTLATLIGAVTPPLGAVWCLWLVRYVATLEPWFYL